MTLDNQVRPLNVLDYLGKGEKQMNKKSQNQKSGANSIRTLIVCVLIIFVLSACNIVRGSGNVTTEIRMVSSFDQVSLNGQGDLIITQGEQESLQIEAEDNLIPVIETEVRGNTLHIGTKNNTSINPTKPVKFFLTMKDISGLEISGSGDITSDSVTADDLLLDVNGLGNVMIDALSAESLEVDISGVGDVRVAGQVVRQVIQISGVGEYAGADLESETGMVKVSGSRNATVWVNQTLGVEIDGSGRVNYYGSPTVNQDISGAGEVNGLGAR